MTPAALSIRRLNFSYTKKQVLYDIHLNIAPHECCLLLGPNGAGKSTLFALLTRLYSHQDGAIFLAGFDLRQAPLKALAQLGVVFQQTTLDLDLSVQQNLFYHAALQGMRKKKAKKAIQTQLEYLQMYARKDELVRKLNGGHRRRVEIARALLHEPTLLLLDEPTVGLDVSSRNAIVAHVHQLVENAKLSVLWSTHLMDEVYDSDKVAVIHQGKIKAMGRVNDVLAASKTSSIEAAFFKLTRQQGAE